MNKEELKADYWGAVSAYVRKQDATQNWDKLNENIELKDDGDGTPYIDKWAYDKIAKPTDDELVKAITMGDVAAERKQQRVERNAFNVNAVCQGIFNEVQRFNALAFGGQDYKTWAAAVSVPTPKAEEGPSPIDSLGL